MGLQRNITFPLFGDGIFTQEGADWKHSRKLLRLQFTHKQYQDLEVFREHVDHLISNIAAAGGVVDLQPLFFRLTLDTTTAFLFGESVYSLKEAQIPAKRPSRGIQRCSRICGKAIPAARPLLDYRRKAVL
jgi:cytochrome P450